MYKKVLNFVKYNNAFTIVFIVCFFSSGIVFAASPTARDSIYSSRTAVTSVDNSLILSTDLDNFNFNLKINSITDDDKNYYADYSYQTLAIVDGAWQVKQVEKTLTVSKAALGDKDLGLYVAKELSDNINYELSSLKRVQKLEEAAGSSQKVVTVEYSGLIGKFLNPRTEIIEGYNPVIPEAVPEVAATVEARQTSVVVSTPNPESQVNQTSNPTSSQTESAQEPTVTSTVTSTSTATATTSTATTTETATATTTETATDYTTATATTSTETSETATSTSDTTQEPTLEATSTTETPAPTVETTTASDTTDGQTQ